jgi:hypothetical protein
MPTITVDAVGDVQPRSSNIQVADEALVHRFSLTWMGATIDDVHSTDES